MKRYIVEVREDKTEWLNEFGKFHREDGPAVEYKDGHKEWWVGGKLHRLDGPAVEWSDGSKKWLVDGKLHRLDGPAVEWSDGTRYWCVNGKFHRLDGPAIELATGINYWYINDKELTESEFNKQIEQTTCEGKVVEIDGIKYKLTKV